MRKVAMKRRGRPAKVDSSTDENNKDDFEANGDINNDKSASKRKSRSTRRTEENGKEDDSSEDRSAGGDTNGENESSDEPETKKRKSSSVKKAANESDNEADAKKGRGKKGDDGSDEEHETKKKKASKKAAQSKKAVKEVKEEEGDDEEEEEGEDEENYEVEAIINDKKVGSGRHYLIRWKGYGSDSDTWEPEKTLNCVELLQEYKDNKTKKKKASEEFDENKDFEVDRILEVHFKRDGKREFLVVWKGYPATESTWEPEENMACPDLVARFMSKVEKAKTIDQRALRAVRAPTERFTLTTKDSGRRISKRNSNKQRVRYVDCE